MKIFLCALAIFLITASAVADLTGTEMDVELIHAGSLGDQLGASGGAHEYGEGTSDDYSESLFGFPFGSWRLTSPPNIPASFPNGQAVPENLVQVDFSLFNDYSDFSAETGTLTFSGLAEDVALSSLTVFTVTGQEIAQNPVIEAPGNAFSVSWIGGAAIGDGTADPVIFVGWSSVPAPGAMALLGLAGIATGRRRRRR